MDPEIQMGKPELPQYIMMLEVPLNAKQFNVQEANPTWEKELSLQYPISIHKAQTSSCINLSSDEITQNDIREYDNSRNANSYKPVSIIDEYYIKGTSHFIVAKISPVRLLNDTTIKICSSINFSITYENYNSDAMSSMATVSDPEILDNLQKGKKDLFIITTDNLKETCKDLAIWKSEKGFNVNLKSIEEILNDSRFRIGSNEQIVDAAASLRAYLKSNFKPEIDQYCFIIGPQEHMPIRYLFQDSLNDYLLHEVSKECFVPTDLYFSDLIQDFNLYRHEMGMYTQDVNLTTYSPCIYVGRLLCDSADEFHNYFQKLMIYEAFPGRGDSEYLNRGLLTQQSQHLGYSSLFDKIKSFQVSRLTDNQGNTFESNLPRGSQIIKELSNVGIASLQGHGKPGYIAVSGKNGAGETWRIVTAMDDYDVTHLNPIIPKQEKGCGFNKMTNIWKPGILYSLSCDAMPFDRVNYYDYKYNMGYSYTCGGLYGGVAMLGNTRTGWDTANQIIESYFANYVLEDNPIGKAHALAFTRLAGGKYAKAAHNVLGDPTISMWLSKPSKLEFSFSNMSSTLSLSGSQLSGSEVCIYDGSNNIIQECSSNSVNIPLGSSFDNTLYSVSICKPQFLPFIGLYGQNGNLVLSNKEFFVNFAEFGSNVISGKTTGDFSISDGGNVKVTALDYITIESGFKINQKGVAEFRCLGKINLTGTQINNEGKLIIRASKTTLNPGVKIQKGAYFEIQCSETLY